jgi:uncharacterized protein
MTGHPIPFAALDGKVGVMGVTGSGKTFTAIGLAELLLEAGRQTIIIDPTGVYNGLRTAFPIPIFGGKFGDIAITESDGSAIAKAIIDGNLSAIVDVSLLLKESHAAARRFMAGFVSALKTANTRARYIVMDEADEFMPENASGAVTQLFGDLKWIVRRGRSEGWRMLMVTQRPQDIAKSVLTQCETMVIHKLTSPQDRKALQEWVKGTADAEQAKVVLDSMAKLATGEAWVWSPVHDLLERVTMPLNKSEDRSKTPDADDAPRATLGFKEVDMEALRLAMAKPVQDAVEQVSGQSLDADKQQLLDDLANQLADETARADVAEKELLKLRLLTDVVSGIVTAIHTDSGKAIERLSTINNGELIETPASRYEPAINEPVPSKPVKANTVQADDTQTPAKASPAAIAIADLLDRISPAKVTWAQAASMTGRKSSGGNFNSARKWLRGSGRVAEHGDLICSTNDTPAGLTRTEAFDLWKSILPAPAPKMMDAMRLWSSPNTKDRLGCDIGAQPRGGNFNSGLAHLRRNGLLDEAGDGRMCLKAVLPGQAS